MINKKLFNEKGITLIALVVTIIVLLILAAISLRLVIGNNGIINRAKSTTNTWVISREGEKVIFEEMNNEVLKLSGSNDKEIIDAVVSGIGHAYIIYNNGDVFECTYDSPHFDYDDPRDSGQCYVELKDVTVSASPILTNVKKLEPERYYISTSNELYYFTYDNNGVYIKIADNVKECNDDMYLTESGDLYFKEWVYDEELDEDVLQWNKIAENVVHTFKKRFITSSKELYTYRYDYNEDKNVSTFIAGNVKKIQSDFGTDYYITETNELYSFEDWDTVESAKIAENVKDVCYNGYISTSNELYWHREYNEPYEKVLDNVKGYWGPDFYLTTSNEFHLGGPRL